MKALGKLPEEFDKHDLVRTLGWEPSKATLARSLDALCEEKKIAIVKPASGRTPARYRKLQRISPAAPRDAAEAGSEVGDGSGSAAEPR